MELNPELFSPAELRDAVALEIAEDELHEKYLTEFQQTLKKAKKLTYKQTSKRLRQIAAAKLHNPKISMSKLLLEKEEGE